MTSSNFSTKKETINTWLNIYVKRFSFSRQSESVIDGFKADHHLDTSQLCANALFSFAIPNCSIGQYPWLISIRRRWEMAPGESVFCSIYLPWKTNNYLFSRVSSRVYYSKNSLMFLVIFSEQHITYRFIYAHKRLGFIIFCAYSFTRGKKVPSFHSKGVVQNINNLCI